MAYRRYIRDFNAELDIKEFYELFWRHIDDAKIKIPKAMEAAFAQPETEANDGSRPRSFGMILGIAFLLMVSLV